MKIEIIKMKSIMKQIFKHKVLICSLMAFILLFVMFATSNLTFADVTNSITVKDKTYTRYYETDDNHGYIYFGSFPQSVADNLAGVTNGLPSYTNDRSHDGEIVTIDEGEYKGKYLYELGLGIGHWYKFEPIKWRILDFDGTEGKEKLVLLTDKVLELRNYDTQNRFDVKWDGSEIGPGTPFEMANPASAEKLTYPSLRMYLNSYDTTKSSYSIEQKDIDNLYKFYGRSELKYDFEKFEKFYDKGFYEKAFSEIERDSILNDINENFKYNPNDQFNSYFDGYENRMLNGNNENDGKYDKVRVLTWADAYDVSGDYPTARKYGFVDADKNDLDRRSAYATPYAISKFDSDEVKNNTKIKAGWWLISRFSKTLGETASGYQRSPSNVESLGGVRPVISLDLSSLSIISGTGIEADPYVFDDAYKIAYDLKGGTVSTANPTSYHVETETFVLNNPTKTGYDFAGWTGSNGDEPQTTVSITKGSTGNKNFVANYSAKTDIAYKVNHYQMNADKTTYSLKETEDKTGTADAEITISTLQKPYDGFLFEGGKAEAATTTKPQTFDSKTTILADGSREINLYYSIKQSSGGGGSSGGGSSSGGGGGSSPAPKKETKAPEKVKITFKAFINGYEDGTFKPKNFVTREEVSVIASRTNADFDEEANYINENKYTDTLGRWSRNYLGFTYFKKLLRGYEDGSFHPVDYMTRGELATLALNILSLKETNENNEKTEKKEIEFSDIEGKWYEENVKKLSKEGIINGYEDGTFLGDNYVTRIEVAIVFNRITERQKDLITDEKRAIAEQLFIDINKTDWFIDDLVLAALDHEKEVIKDS